ncbi:MAG: FKBP-type peptidyl-prolyl cis-trans isomerase [Prevotella sp.]|nr:FKBP-type peptidyl-prolyl cis-trans isomerase [Prevotella sp.]
MLPRLKDQFRESPDSINDVCFNTGFINAIIKDYGLMSVGSANEYFASAVKKAEDAINEANRKAGEVFLAENKEKEGVITTESGLQYKVLVEGDGVIPTEDQEVTVKYEGRLIDGTVFDSSYKRPGETAKFSPKKVIKGWTEALTMMPVGSKWEIYIPQELGYGERKSGSINPYSALIFTVELISVEDAKPKK